VSAEVGQAAEREFLVTDAVLEHFAEASGDRNPIHFDDEYASGTRFGGRIAHGMLTGGFISAVIANDLPGPGTIYLAQDLAFRAPVRPGETVRVRVELVELGPRGRAELQTTAWVGATVVAEGRARVLLPA
jgi:3-hydroxybutyryl-CoA dehydratase